MGTYLESYLNFTDEISPGITPSIKTTIDALIPKYIKTFSFRGHSTGLLLGNVQSGKTGQIFGIISAAADEGFQLFVMLTTDNIYLHEQTFKRALKALDAFTVCGESDDIRFNTAQMRKPALIIVKKNAKVLQRWRNNLSASGFCSGRALFIIDDEGDAASLNTKINQKEQSTVNKNLEEMKGLANSSIYLQVTATPQALLLQAKASGWRPAFMHYFAPGAGYIGGDLVYADPPSSLIRLTAENELDLLRRSREHITDGLRSSLMSFLVSAAHIVLTKQSTVCNFLVHPSIRIADHARVAERLGEYLNQMVIAVSENKMRSYLEAEWNDLKKTEPDLVSLDKIHDFVKDKLSNEEIKIRVMNSRGSPDIDYSKGINIIVGGNSLGRGVTFPKLQTVYYCRTAKAPQADTFWQHCRMFGYDRDPKLMRIFIPPSLFKLFSELNNGNRAILVQVAAAGSLDDVGLLYPPGVKPTRMNVVDKDSVDLIVGGVNYFPALPKRSHVKQIDEMLEVYDDKGSHEITLNQLINLLEKFESESKSDWSNAAFINCIKALKAAKTENKAVLIVRRGRSITKGTGTLLSPDDRSLGDSITDYPVLILYRLEGEKNKGWEGQPLWVPNIKLPAGRNFFKTNR